jgi:hypothetical protein
MASALSRGLAPRVRSRLISPSGDKTVTRVNHSSATARGRDHVGRTHGCRIVEGTCQYVPVIVEAIDRDTGGAVEEDAMKLTASDAEAGAAASRALSGRCPPTVVPCDPELADVIYGQLEPVLRPQDQGCPRHLRWCDRRRPRCSGRRWRRAQSDGLRLRCRDRPVMCSPLQRRESWPRRHLSRCRES